MKLIPLHIALFLASLSFSSRAQQVACGQENAEMPSHHMSSNGQMGGMAEMMEQMHPKTFIAEVRHHAASGTSAEPNSTPTPMLMLTRVNWMLMFHGNVFVLDNQQSSPRGGNKFFSTNWFMAMAHISGTRALTIGSMLTLEPATVTGRRYPLLFQQGETAYGVPIADGQHPHDFFMELAAIYDWKLGEKICCRSIWLRKEIPPLDRCLPASCFRIRNPVGRSVTTKRFHPHRQRCVTLD